MVTIMAMYGIMLGALGLYAIGLIWFLKARAHKSN